VGAECVAEVLADAPPAAEVGLYLEKYREGIGRIGFDPGGFARAYSVAIRATPTPWQYGSGSYRALCHAGTCPFVLSVEAKGGQDEYAKPSRHGGNRGAGKAGRGTPRRGGRRGARDEPVRKPGTVRGDLLTVEGLDAAVRGVETVIHCASSPYRKTREVDVAGTGRLLEAAVRAGVSHFVYISIVAWTAPRPTLTTGSSWMRSG
jgi:hypothetical protein